MGETFNSKNFSCKAPKDKAVKGAVGLPPPPPLYPRPKKSFPVEVDPDTGDTFINLNGKKLKIVPESQKTQKPLLSVPKVLTNTIKTKRTSTVIKPPPTVGKSLVLVTAPKTPAKSPLIAVPPNEKRYVKVKRNSLSEKITDNVGKLNEDVGSSDRTTDDGGRIDSSVADKMKALDLSKTTKSDNCSQTQIVEYNDIGVQVPETPSDILREDVFLGSMLADIDFSDILGPEPPRDMLNDEQAINFFQDLRVALQPDDKGNMPIHMAVIKNNLSMLNKNWFILRALKQSIDIPNSNGLTALQLSITMNASKQLITYLLENHARLDVHDADGNNVLHLALEYQREDALRALLDFSDKFNVINEYNHEGMTPLMIGAINGLHGCVDILLDYGATVDLRDQISGRTALFHAAENQDMEMVKLLMHYNANTKIKNFFGTSPHDAMYEIEEISPEVKHMILGKNLKRKQFEEMHPRREVLKIIKSEPRIKTYSKERIKSEPSGSDVVL